MNRIDLLAGAVLLCICTHAVCQGSPSVNAKHIVVPGYPALARQARQQGDVTATVTVEADGEVANVSVKGPDLLRDHAVNALRQWTFTVPAGAPHVFTVTFRFKLAGDESLSPNTRFTADLPTVVDIVANPTTEKPGPLVVKRKR
jgi:TonB family protein